MATQIISAVVLLLTCVVGLWKFFARRKSERRRLADEAMDKINKAASDGDESDLLDGFDGINRANR